MRSVKNKKTESTKKKVETLKKNSRKNKKPKKNMDKSLFLKSEKQYEAIMQSANDAIFIGDAKTGIIVDVNNKGEKLIGLPANKIIGLHQTQLHPKENNAGKEYKEGVKSPQKNHKGLYVLNRKTGLIPVEISSNVFELEGRKLVVGIFKNMSLHVEKEKKIIDSEARYRSLFENMTSAFALHKVITDKKGKPVDYEYIEVNKAFEKFTGLKRNTVIGKKVKKIIPGIEKDKADWIGNFGRVGLHGGSWEAEQGSEVLGRWYTVRSYSPKKGYFVAVFDEITKKKQIELNIKEQNKFSELRLGLWRVAAEKNMKEEVMIKTAIEGLGKTLNVSRVVYSSLGKEHIEVKQEWKAEGAKGNLVGIKTPAKTAVHVKKQIILTEENVIKMVSGKAKDPFISVIKILAKVTERQTSLLTPLYVKGTLRGFIACIATSGNEKYWTATKKNMAQEVVQIISKSIENKIGLSAVAAQNRYNILRADIWKLATDKNLSEEDIFDKVFKAAGPILDIHRISYGHLTEKYSYTRNEWKAKGVKGSSIGMKMSRKIFQELKYRKMKVVDSTSILEMVPKALRPVFKIAVKRLVKKFGDNPGIVTPFYVGDKIEGVVTCVGKNESVNEWTEEKKNVLLEVVNIISKMIGQMRAEYDLSDSEEKYRTVFDSINDAVFVISINQNKMMPGSFIEVNEEACRSLGYTRAELLNMSVKDITTGMTFKNVPAVIGNIVTKGSDTLATFHLTKAGRVFPVELKVRIIDFNNRKAILGIARDIEEWKKNEDAIIASNAMNKARNAVWELVSSEDKTEEDVLQGGLKIIGPVVGADRTVFSSVTTGYFANAFEWKEKNIVGTSKIKFPKALYDLFDVKKQEVFGKKEILEKLGASSMKGKNLIVNPLKTRAQKTEEHTLLVTPYVIEGENQGLISCSAKGGRGHWTQERKQLVAEIASILASAIESKRAEKALIKSEEQFRTLTENTLVGISIIQNDKMVYINPAGLKIIGISFEEAIDKSIINFMTKESRTITLERHRARNAGKKVTESYEVSINTNNGGVKYLELRAALIDFKGSGASLASFIDITERKEIENRIKESEEKHRKIVNNMRDGLMVSGQDGIVFANNQMSEIIGYSLDEILEGKIDFMTMVAPEEKVRVAEEYAQMGKRGWKTSITEYWAIRKDGGRVYLRGRISISEVPGQTPIYYIFITDITEKRISEDALKESEEKFRTLSEQALVAICVSENGKVKYINKGYEDIFGYSHEEAASWGPQNLIETIHPDYRDQMNSEIEKNINAPAGSSYHYQIQILTKAGESKWTDVYVRKVMYEEVISDFALFVDVTVEKQAEEKLRDIIEELGESNAELEKFAYVASHDLQEPLRMVTNYVQLLERRYGEKLDSDGKEFIGYAVEGAERMRALIKDLLAYSRMGSTKKSNSELNLNEIISFVLYNLDSSIQDSRAKINVSKLPIITGDKIQMIQLFQNLIGNALKFLNKNDAPKIDIFVEKGDGEWIFSVKDNGIGISLEYFDKIFTIFQRLHTREKYEGTGIGLSLCRKIVEKHGGKIWVESEINKGSEFKFSVPDVANKVGGG